MVPSQKRLNLLCLVSVTFLAIGVWWLMLYTPLSPTSLRTRCKLAIRDTLYEVAIAYFSSTNSLRDKMAIVQITSNILENKCDPWKRKFHYIIMNSNDYFCSAFVPTACDFHRQMHGDDTGCLPYYRVDKYCVVIWSSGPNGENEHGLGDDIVFPNCESLVPASMFRSDDNGHAIQLPPKTPWFLLHNDY